MIWIKYTKDKSITIVVFILINLINQIKKKFNSKIAIIKINNNKREFELQFQLKISKKGLIFELLSSEKHSINKIAKKKIQNINIIFKSLISESEIQSKI